MNIREIRVGSRPVGAARSPLVIAEVGSNHDGDLGQAIALIEASAQAGADAVKFQLFHPDDLYPPEHAAYPILQRLALPTAWLPELATTCANRSIEFLASAFCPQCVADLEAVGIGAHKVASSEITNLALVRTMAETGRPLLLSTGMANLADVARAVEVCEAVGNKSLVVMQCTSLYPTPPQQANLRAMVRMGQALGHLVGFSDHTLGVTVPVAAAALGARVIEKHVTLDRSLKGPDHFYAVEPDELASLCQAVGDVHDALGQSEKQFLSEEREVGRRRGVYATVDLAHGTVLTPEVLRADRPAVGIDEHFLEAVHGARLRTDLAAGAPLCWEHLHNEREAG